MPTTNILYLNNTNDCGTGRMQNKGTCWFHAILNIFLLSFVGRKMLREQLRLYMKNHNLLNIRNNSNACPMRGTINKQYFWSYVRYKLQTLKYGKASRNNLVSENHLIRNLNLRKANAPTTGGTKQDLKLFVDTIFPNSDIGFGMVTMFGDKPPSKGISIYSNSNKTAFGAFIKMHWYKKIDGELVFHQAHAICGFICKKQLYIYDSNNLRAYKLNWLREPTRVAEYLNRRYGMHSNWEHTKLEYVILYK